MQQIIFSYWKNSKIPQVPSSARETLLHVLQYIFLEFVFQDFFLQMIGKVLIYFIILSVETSNVLMSLGYEILKQIFLNFW